MKRTEYTIPKLASAAASSEGASVLVSSLSKYLKVDSNCSNCAGVRFVIFLDTICGRRGQFITPFRQVLHSDICT